MVVAAMTKSAAIRWRLARKAVGQITPDYAQRAFGLSRCGSELVGLLIPT